jgi:VanZ family protein
MSASRRFARRSLFVRWAATAYVGVVLYASLYPMTGWRVTGWAGMWARLLEWPRYYTYADVALNVAAYLPLGFLLVLLLRVRLRPMQAAAAVLLLAIALSGLVEVLQALVPPRVPSALDVFCNVFGAWIGAWLGLAVGERWLLHGHPSRWRREHLVGGVVADLGLTLIGLWLLVQWQPALALFGLGDVRGLFPQAALAPSSARAYVLIEAGVTACGTLALSSIVACIARKRVMVLLLAVLAGATALKSVASSVLYQEGHWLLWLTPGTAIGIGAGLAAGGFVLRAPLAGRVAVGAAAVLAGVVLVNAFAPNAYVASALQPWRHGHFWSLAGTTGIVATVWPLLALSFLGLAATRRNPS